MSESASTRQPNQLDKAQGSSPSRRTVLAALVASGVGTLAFQKALAVQAENAAEITAGMIENAEWIAGIELDEEERLDVADSIRGLLRDGEQLRQIEIDADVVPSLVFRPDFEYARAGTNIEQPLQISWSYDAKVRRPPEGDLPFSSIATQASLLADGQVSSRELTEIYLWRLKQFDPLLHCVVTLVEEHALNEAEAADTRRRNDQVVGILDGIPWVAKDLIAIPPWKTTWGAEPFREQVRNDKATVATLLEKAGAVLLAKVSLGALAWGDVWFEEKTRNPWNPNQGSSGSSAGSAAAVAAGLTGFALGSETLGSIVSPCTRCRTSGLRPTFGRVSRAGCMPLAWSMDKIGPIARHVEDLAWVFASIIGIDQHDPTLVDKGFLWPRTEVVSGLRVGVTGDRLNATEQQVLELLEAEGAELIEIDLSTELPVNAMSFMLGVEASSVFEDAYRDDPKADYGRWPRTFRNSQFVPAVQYMRAARLRSQLIHDAEKELAKVDVVLGGNDLVLTNLTGHPSLVVSCGSSSIRVPQQVQEPPVEAQAAGEGSVNPDSVVPERKEVAVPGVVKLTAAAYRESQLLHVGNWIQSVLPPTPSQPMLVH